MRELLKFSRNIILSNTGKKLTCLHLHDIICMIGEIVVSGGNRRSSLISLSDLKDNDIRHAKQGMFYLNYPYRCRANNSAVYNEKPTMIEFMREWLALAESGSGERGIFNRGSLIKAMPDRRRDLLGDRVSGMGGNPCVTGDTWVQTIQGPKQVLDLLGKKVDLIVDGECFGMETDGFIKTGHKTVYQLKTALGYILKLTEDHPLMKVDPGKDSDSGKDLGWTKLRDLRPGDAIRLSRHQWCSWPGFGSYSDGVEYGKAMKICESASSDFYRGFISSISIPVTGDPSQLQSIQRMMSRLGIGSKIEKETLTVIPLTYQDVIESIHELSSEDVYDVTVKDIHAFDANGIYSSNCNEINLQSKQFCNLTEVIARPNDTLESLKSKIRIATVIGTYQATLTNFKYISKEWTENQVEERLLGVSITGHWDCSALRNPETLAELKRYSISVNREYAEKFGIRPATAITTSKPSGTVSQLVNSASGIHARYAPYYIRRIRISATDPLLKLMKDQKFPVYPEVGQDPNTATTFVLEFPVKAPEGAVCTKDLSAIAQLEYTKMVKTNYIEHNTSVTINVRPDEWMAVGQWVWDNWDAVCGMSFFPYNDHIYQLAPYEEISKERYEEMVLGLPKVDFSKLVYYEKDDNSIDLKREVACAGGACEL